MAQQRRISCHIMTPLVAPPDEHTLLVLMDGNERAKRGSSGGYKAGGRKLVELIQHLRGSPRVGRIVACVLSKENVSKRTSAFWAEVHEALVEFGAAIVGGALAGVRIDLAGGLGRLRGMGGHARACADDFEAIVQAQVPSPTPTLRLTLAVDYSSDIAVATRTSIILRTGMQEAGVVRTSGIDACPSHIYHGTTTLWPELSMAEVDATLSLASRRPVASFAPGYDVDSLEALIEALSADRTLPDLDVTLQSQSSVEDVCALLERLLAPGSFARQTVAALVAEREGPEPRYFGASLSPRHLLRIVDRGDHVKEHSPEGFDVIVAPGQDPAGFVLPAHPRVGYANVWASGLEPREIVFALSRAVHDRIENVPLRGAPRGMAQASAVTDSTRTPHGLHTDDDARAFVARLCRWATRSELWNEPSDCPGATSYLRTAFHLFGDTAAADAVGKYMILVALGDVLFDGGPHDETTEARFQRLAVSTTYLRDAIVAGYVSRPPLVEGGKRLEAIARQWVAMQAGFQQSAPSELLSQWRAALDTHYSSSVREYAPLVVDNPLVRWLAGEDTTERAAHHILAGYLDAAPAVLAGHLRHLVAVCREAGAIDAAPLLELRVWLYLLDVNTIGAGLAFRTAALTIPKDEAPREAITALDESLPLLDFRIRLANDLSGFVMAMGRDRDRGKVSSCGLLVPERASGVERAATLMRAIDTTSRVARWLDNTLDAELGKLTAVWPRMGAWVVRGCKIGVHAYEAGHYTTFAEDEFASVLAAE